MIIWLLYSVRVEKSCSLTKGVLCMECKVGYFPSYYKQLALKYVLILFIVNHVHVMQTYHVISRVCEDAKGKETEITKRRLLWMSMTITRNSAGVNGLKDLWKKPLMPQDFHLPGYRKEKVDIGGVSFSIPTKRYRLSRCLLVDACDREVIRRKSTTSIRPKSTWHLPS